jgi:Domain of unknown function (DUF4189)
MFAIARKLALAAASFGSFVAAIGATNAAGALAVGVCGAYGYGFDYSKIADARAAAISKCADGRCKVVGVIRKGCAAMALDVKNPCGSYGWALNSHLGKAENISMQRCAQFGGRECVVRAWACDEKG